jgi:hypothetical protein
VPTIMTIFGYRFFFYSREETRMHVHVEYQGRETKIWLDTFEVAENRGFYQFELNDIQRLTRKNEKAIKKAWISHFG